MSSVRLMRGDLLVVKWRVVMDRSMGEEWCLMLSVRVGITLAQVVRHFVVGMGLFVLGVVRLIAKVVVAFALVVHTVAIMAVKLFVPTNMHGVVAVASVAITVAIPVIMWRRVEMTRRAVVRRVDKMRVDVVWFVVRRVVHSVRVRAPLFMVE